MKSNVFKRVLSFVLTLSIMLAIFSMIDITAFAANDTVTLYQYQSVGNGKKGPQYSGKIQMIKTGDKGYQICNIVYGKMVFKGSSCLLKPDIENVQNHAAFESAFVFDKTTIYFAYNQTTKEIKLGSVDGKGNTAKYCFVGKVHFDGHGKNVRNIIKIDSINCYLYFKNKNTSFKMINRVYFKNESVPQNEQKSWKNKRDELNDGAESEIQELLGNSVSLNKKSGTYVAKNDIILRTGPGYNYPEVSGGISTASFGEELFFDDGVLSTDSVGGNSLSADSVSLNDSLLTADSYSVASIVKKNEVIGITKIQNGWGYTTYRGVSGWLNLIYCSYKGALITKPNPPVVKLLTSPDIPATGTVTVSWDSVYDAKYYKAVLYNSSGAEVKAYGDLYGTTATFTPQDEGVYTIKVYAQNSMYTSDPGVLSQAITVHGKAKVTYLDDNGDVLGTQDVSYNNSSTAPIAPEKEGYTFYGWVDENDSNKSASLNNITGAKTVKAKYTKNKYSVMFLDKDGKQLGDVQQVEYHESAVAPEAPEIEGYIFAGWSSDDYKNVYRLNKSEVIKIYPVYIWENKEIPVTCTITEASRQKDGYYVIFDVENHVDDSTRGRAVVCLKTKSDKLVYTTESAAFSIPGQTKKTGMEVFVPCESAATKAEVIILDNFENSIPISESVSSSIDQSNMWSAWTDYETLPDFDSDTEYETRTVYSYRIKETTTNYTNTKAGYTLYGTRTEHPGAWSGWSDSVIDPFDYPDRTRRVGTQIVNVYSSRTIYDYFHYYNPSKARWSPVQYSGYTQWHACNLTWQLAWKGNSSVSGWSYYGSNYCGSCGAYNMWYPNGSHSESYVSGQKTQYRYYDTTYTYYFYRWGEWSDWQTTPVLKNDNREVKTKTQYRTKSVSAAVEDDSGEIKTVSGTLDSSLAGKYVNLYVTKYIENSDWTNEYVGQAVIGSDGSYSFSFKLREEPSAATGDMTAYIGIQGTDEMQAVKVFEAPKAIYKVEYYDDNEGGNIISTQYVEDGGKATVPAVNPEKEGYIFAGWNNTCTNVKSDMTVRPIFVEQKCTVQYIDPRNPENNKEQICNHGDTFETPEINDSNRECDSGYLVGWDSIERTVINDDETESTIPGEKFVTSNMVVMAEYETKNFDITFVGVNGEIIDAKSVEYEGYVEAPEFPEDDSVDFIAWDIDEEELASVTDSIIVNAIYCFDETTQTPEVSLATGAYEGTQTVTLSCGTPDAVIWYTLDGSDPTENPEAIEYTEPITISESTVLKYYAGSLNANDSNVEQAMYVIDGNGKIVTIHNNQDEDFSGTVMVNDLSEIDEDLLSYEGYEFEGFYYDEALTQPVDIKNDTIPNVVELYAKYTVCSYTVTFEDADGDVIETMQAEYGSSVTPPNMSDIGEMVFIGWDGDYDFILGDTVFTAIYKNRADIVNINLDKSDYTLEEGFSFKLNATVTPEEKSDLTVIWVSEDDSIASVLDDGTVTANKAGETTIYAVAEDDSAIAECKVTVSKSPNYSLCLKESASIGIDSEGNLRGIPVDNNTVTYISSQFRNTASSLKFISADGDWLTGDSKVGTGATINLMNGDKVIDTIKVIVTGDINGDGNINNMDVARIARFVVKKDTPDYYQAIASDVNGNGSVNNRDAAYLMRYLVGKETL